MGFWEFVGHVFATFLALTIFTISKHLLLKYMGDK